MSFEEVVQNTVKHYNKHRSPEVIARLVQIGENELAIDFEGPFCGGCGVNDYFEDFIYELKRYSKVKIAVSSFEQTEAEKFRVKYTFSSDS